MTNINIRAVLGAFIGQRVIDITQHDQDEFADDGKCYVMLMFEDGDYLKFFVGDDGFLYTRDEGDET